MDFKKLKRFKKLGLIFLLYTAIAAFCFLFVMLDDLVLHSDGLHIGEKMAGLRMLLFMIGCVWICGRFHRKEPLPPSEYSSAFSDFVHRHLLKVIMWAFLGYLYIQYQSHNSGVIGFLHDIWRALCINSDHYSFIVLPTMFFSYSCTYTYFLGYLCYCVRDSQLRIKTKKLVAKSLKSAF